MLNLSLSLDDKDKAQLKSIEILIKEKFQPHGIFCFGKYEKGYKSQSIFENGRMGEANKFNYHLLRTQFRSKSV